MIRTAFTNVDEVAKDLHVPPAYIPHYFAKLIGAQASYEASKPTMQKATISGEHALKDLSNLLIKFIREFVLCPKCKLPELEYLPKKDDLGMRCHSCGWKGNLSAQPINDKFKRYVYTHPPQVTGRGRYVDYPR
jgi:translation initiation factor 5